MSEFDRSKSLQQLEGQNWGEPTYDSFLVTECHRLRRVPLREFTPEHLRMMIGQQIGLPYLLPLAFELLCVDPFTAGDYYEGDLLAMVLRIDASFWHEHPQFYREAAAIADRAFSLLSTLDENDRRTARESLAEAYDVFKRAQTTTA
jgi:hypothetical protein